MEQIPHHTKDKNDLRMQIGNKVRWADGHGLKDSGEIEQPNWVIFGGSV
jgi:hypothetical protein